MTRQSRKQWNRKEPGDETGASVRDLRTPHLSIYPADGEFLMRKLSYRSPLYWLTLVVAVGIIFIGVRFLFAPAVAARAFGVPLANPHDMAFLFVKEVRDIVSGLLFLALLGAATAAHWNFAADRDVDTDI